MQRVVITGINGFVGGHLTRELSKHGCEVVGIGNEEAPRTNLDEFVSSYFSCDLSDQESVDNLSLDGINAVINLAGLANVGASFEHPELYKKVNVAVVETLGKAMLKQCPDARMIAVSTGAVYDPSGKVPFDEESAIVNRASTSPYVISKMDMEKAALKLVDNGLDCVVVRPFNHIGPDQRPGFLIPDLAQQIIRAREDSSRLRIGNLETERDYTDVRDVVRAYRELALAPKDRLEHTLYNVCSGKAVKGLDILKMLISQLSPDGDIPTEVDESKIRPNDPKLLMGNNSRLKDDTGWQPQITVEQTIQDFVSTIRQ